MDSRTTLCTGLRELGDEYVECDRPAEWLVGTTPACSECIATFLNDEGETIVAPIYPPDDEREVTPLCTMCGRPGCTGYCAAGNP